MRARTIFPLLIGSSLATACAGIEGDPDARARAGLDRDLAERTAGAPQSCAPIVQGQSLTVVDAETLRYGSGRTLWVVKLRDPCPGMRPLDTLIVEPMGSQYCRGDQVRSFSSVNPIPGPVCVLDSFTPYTR